MTCSVDICDRPTLARGWCKTHYERVRQHGDTRAHLPIVQRARGSAEERFWTRVDKGEGCWLWTGAVNNRGYGTFHPTERTLTSAHRFAYTLVHGSPEGLDVDHLCRVRLCVRPEHLQAVDHEENVRRSFDARGYNRV